MARFSKCSLQRLRYYYTSTTSHSSHPTHFSPARLRNVWISGLLDPSKVTLTLREMLYSGHVDLMEDARKDIIKRDKEHESYIKQESWVSEVRALKKQPGSFTHLKWLINAPTADSITADLTFFNWRKHKMSIMDTTNCFDFTSEVKNALGAFDSAVLVLSSVDGVQDQSIAVDKQMITYQLPRLVFVNDLDQKGANPWQVLNQARSKLQHHCAAVQVPIGLEYNFKGLVDLVQLKAYFFHDSNGKKVVVEEVPTYMEALVSEKRHELIKTVSEVDGKLAEAFCIGKPISAADLKEAVRRATIARKFIPFLMGSAFKYKGLQLLLDGLLNYLPCPTEASNSAIIQSNNEEKVPSSKKQLNEII
uniref:Protein synthesis factor, GTP-binding n=1 Tax=Medicago truncatula TaxID=3880 RepID=Q2HSR6_MEDTR|nr:Protein synthesis factor, GTP-binding [Medicago truncatula]